jgi:hypothetical protein
LVSVPKRGQDSAVISRVAGPETDFEVSTDRVANAADTVSDRSLRAHFAHTGVADATAGLAGESVGLEARAEGVTGP